MKRVSVSYTKDGEPFQTDFDLSLSCPDVLMILSKDGREISGRIIEDLNLSEDQLLTALDRQELYDEITANLGLRFGADNIRITIN